MYRDPHDGSYGLDLRDPALVERDRGQAVERARRISPMPVASCVRMVSQPAGGLLPPSLFERVRLDDRSGLHAASRETVPPDIAGLFVDYMTRVVTGADVRIAFRVPLLGARLVGESERAESLLARVDGFSMRSVTAACLLLDYDSAGRRGPAYWLARRPVPDDATRENLTRMVARSLAFLDEYGPVVWRDFSFEGAYTDRITSGSGDFLTADTLWDMKVSKWPPNSKQTLQLLAYWRLGVHSVHDVYRGLTRLGLFNPRLDTAWILDVDRIDGDLVSWADHELIGYPRAAGGGLTSSARPDADDRPDGVSGRSREEQKQDDPHPSERG